MLKELVEFAEANQGRMMPLGYRDETTKISWFLEVAEDGSSRVIQTSYEKPRPTTNKSVNIRPKLLADTAEYVLGIGEKPERARKAREAFWALIAEAEAATGSRLLAGLSKAPDHFPPAGMESVKAKDVLLVRKKGKAIPIEDKDIQAFWATKIADDVGEAGQCGSCGGEARLLRIMPTGVKGFPQDVKLAACNTNEQPSFGSYGLEQNLNAPLCFNCGARASASLSHLLTSPRHKMPLVRGDAMAQQVAIFWLKDDQVETTDGRGVDVGGIVHLVNTGRLPDDNGADEAKHTATISDAEGLLKTPWKLRDGAALSLDEDAFHLAVLSANVSRLVLRDWIHGSLKVVQERMRLYLDATKLVGGWGEGSRGQPIQAILGAIGAYSVEKDRRRWESNPPQADLVRSLLGAVYLGRRAPRALTVQTVRVLRNPSAWAVDRLVQTLLSAVKLERTLNGDNLMTPTETLDATNGSVAYQAGRLFAVLEQAQGAASKWKVNATIVERSYGAASTAPRNTFPPLIRLATTAHLPKAGYLNPVMEEVMSRIDEAGGLPKTFALDSQADFALGFYHQRATFRAESKAFREAKAQAEQEEAE